MSSNSSLSAAVYTKLDLSDSSSYLPSNLFQPKSTFFNRKQNTTGVQQLLLRRNRLDSLTIYAKALFQLKQYLTELSLRENRFTRFPIEVLVLTNLTSLSLANNQLETIEKNTLSLLTNLQWLNLSNNRLKQLPADLVACHYLRGLDLESNELTVFPEVIFYLTRLEVLMIHKNKIRHIKDHYTFPSTLHTLNLAFNQLSQFPESLITHPPDALTHLHLSGNRIRCLPPNFLSTGYTKLVSLDFHTCYLKHIHAHFFSRLATTCPDLRRLNLAINKLTHLPTELGLLTQLQWLNLNDNLLITLPASISNLTHLVKLGLVQNKLQCLPPFMFLHMLELQKLDIRRNQLRYLPPSILALAPRQEVDIHVNLAVPHNVFNTLSSPSTTATCGMIEKSCMDSHPYGGSLRTLLFYENPTIEHVDGIICQFDTHSHGDDDEDDFSESVQVMSMSSIFSTLQSNSTIHGPIKPKLYQAILPPHHHHQHQHVRYCHDEKFRKSDHPMSNRLSEIDEDSEGSAHSTTLDNETEMAQTALCLETKNLLTRVPSLYEQCLRAHLSHVNALFLSTSSRHHQRHTRSPPTSLLPPHLTTGAVIGRLDQDRHKMHSFISSALPDHIVPNLILSSTLCKARQCDYCLRWYGESKLQVGYLARLCNNRLQVPVRFNMCGLDCAVEASIQLYTATVDWQARQSLAGIDASLLLSQQQQHNGAGDNSESVNERNDEIQQTQIQGIQQRLGRRDLLNNLPLVGGYWNAVGLSSAKRISLALSTLQQQQSLVASDSSISLSNSSSSVDDSSASLARAIKNRVTQFASSFFNPSSHHNDGGSSSSSSSGSGNGSGSSSSSKNSPTGISNSLLPSLSASSSSTTTTTSVPRMMMTPLVYPNLNIQQQPQSTFTDPPSVISVTSRLVEGRIQTERSQPHLRLSTPTPNPTAYNHLPRDAIRLEKF